MGPFRAPVADMGGRLRFVLLTAGKELRETVRDRRTLAVMILFPLVVYPLLALVSSQVVAQRERGQRARPSVVAVNGHGELADEVRGRLDKASDQFKRQPTGSAADVDAGRLDALVTVRQPPGARPSAEIALDATRDESRRAEERLSKTLEGLWPPGCAPRLDVRREDLAPASRMGGYILSKALPLMILLMVLLGAFYPAIDVTAGERERGTLETVLAAPVPRRDLLLGKVLAVTALASASGFLNLGSMSLTLVQVVNLAAPDADLPVPWTRAAATGLVVLPTAFLLASLFVAVGSLARGFKEAQNFLVPVYFLFFAPAMLGALGEMPLGPGLALVPGLNVSLLARDIALGKTAPISVALVLGSTLAWGLVALIVAARFYVSERFLAVGDREPGQRRKPVAAGRPGVRLDLPPSVGEALALFAIGFVSLYYVFMPLQRLALVRGLLISQWGGLFGLAVVYALVTRRPFRAVVGLHPAPAPAWLGAVLMGAAGWVVANLIAQWVLPPPKEYLEEFRKLLFPELPRGLGASLFLFALTPAVCEEVLFRGLILRGLLTRLAPATAIALCGAMFGLFHIDVYRLLPTALLGVMLSFITWRSGSLLPSIAAHFLNNAILVLLGHLGLDRRVDTVGTAGKLAMLAGAIVVLLAGIAVMLRAVKPPEFRSLRPPS
jgi:sodium transport system permease protein